MKKKKEQKKTKHTKIGKEHGEKGHALIPTNKHKAVRSLIRLSEYHFSVGVEHR